MSKIGPYELNQIYCGNCLDLMPGIPDGSVDMILADNPYGAIDARWDSLIPLEPLWEQYKRIIKPNGVIVLVAQDVFAAILLLSNEGDYRHKWIWEKDKCGNFIAAQAEPLKVTEEILVFCQYGFSHNANNRATYNPQMTQADTYQNPITKKYPRNGLSISQLQIRPNPTPVGTAVGYDGWKRYPKNILYFPVDHSKTRLHPTQKPVALFAYLIRTYTNPGDIVLDNCIGSGTTAIAAIETGRNWLGFEKDEMYYKLAKDRIAKRLQQPFLPEIMTKQPKAKQLELV